MIRNKSSAWFSGGVPRFPFYYGWVIAGVAILAQMVSGFGHPYVATGFIGPIRNELGWSLTTISGMYTAGSLLAAPLLLIMGRLLDRFGSRTMLTLICVLMGAVTMGMSRVTRPTHLLIGFAAIRLLGESSLSLVSITLVSTWFLRLRGRATAIATIGLATAHSTFPLLTQLLITQFGWRGAWIGFGLIIWAILLIPAALLVRRSPESVGLVPDGVPDGKPVDTPETAADKVKSTSLEINFTLSDARRTRTFWLLLACGISFPLTITGLLFHYIPLMQTKGISSQLSAAALLLWGPSMVLGNMFGGFLVDRIQARFMILATQILLAIAMLWALVISQPWQAFVFVIVAGSCGGIMFNTYAVTWANYFGRLHIGSIRGVASMNTLFCSALGALPFGLIFDLTGNYDLAILVLLSLPAIGAVASVFAVPPRKSPHLDTK